jgi:hypothetical protein
MCGETGADGDAPCLPGSPGGASVWRYVWFDPVYAQGGLLREKAALWALDNQTGLRAEQSRHAQTDRAGTSGGR